VADRPPAEGADRFLLPLRRHRGAGQRRRRGRPRGRRRGAPAPRPRTRPGRGDGQGAGLARGGGGDERQVRSADGGRRRVGGRHRVRRAHALRRRVVRVEGLHRQPRRAVVPGQAERQGGVGVRLLLHAARRQRVHVDLALQPARAPRPRHRAAGLRGPGDVQGRHALRRVLRVGQPSDAAHRGRPRSRALPGPARGVRRAGAQGRRHHGHEAGPGRPGRGGGVM
ncbi:MAG: NAD(P)H dehydrogenase (quinone), Type IV, partial [uncultured Acetobacteraceae bacterium]